jgi:hypothetical protein
MTNHRLPSLVRRFSLLLVLIFIGAFVSGCKDRSDEVIGGWDWGKYTVQMDGDMTWAAVEKGHNTYHLGGTWSMSGDEVMLTYTTVNAPDTMGSIFTLSQDAKQLAIKSGAADGMTKL